jgi:uncharacterized protein YidB (DUF937 family)
MGFLELLGSVTRKGGGAGQAVGDLLKGGGPAGGLGGLLGKLDDAGLGDVGRSWVARGKNLPISAEQIERVLGSEHLRPVAAKLGVSPEEAAKHVARVLPKLVDAVTPDGEVPDQATVERRLGGAR